MSVTRVTVASDKPADPNGAPPAHVDVKPDGSVQVDPAKVPPAGDKPAGDRPSWLPEKFKSVEEFVKSHSELEKKLGTPKAGDAPADKPTAVTPEAAKAAGIDMNALTKEFAEKGELSAETLKNLNDKGFDKAAVDGYIAGQQAIADKLSNTLAEVAGGKTQLAATIAWAQANLSAEDAAAYDAALDSGDLRLARLALQGVVAQYEAANGKDPSLVNGGEGTRTTGVEPFGSQHEIVTAMSDKRYSKDPVYRAKVEARMHITPSFGTR